MNHELSRKPAATLRRLQADDAPQLAVLFQRLAQDPEAARFFHPHPLSAAAADELCRTLAITRDRYYVADRCGPLIGYMMLRGWDEGYTVPSFGCAVDPRFRGAGLGRRLLETAIAESRACGAAPIRRHSAG